VITATAGTGLSNTGTATNPVFNNTGVLSAGTGLGISNTGTATAPIITNTGVRTISLGGGLSTAGPATDPYISNTGIWSLAAGFGLFNTGSNNPTISISSIMNIYAFDNFRNPPNPTTTLWFPLSSNPNNYNVIDLTGTATGMALHTTTNNASSGLTTAQIVMGPGNVGSVPSTITSYTTPGYNQCTYYLWYKNGGTQSYQGSFTLNPNETANIAMGAPAFLNSFKWIVWFSISPKTAYFGNT